MSWDINKFKDNELFFYKMHIMCELAIPLAIHLGIKNIYTVGWDLSLINNKNYFCENKYVKYYKNNQEKIFIPYIVKLLNEKDINIYKIKEISPILLPYYNLFQ